jgi:hypothetical protein
MLAVREQDLLALDPLEAMECIMAAGAVLEPSNI